MNKVHKSVWNESVGAWVAASELSTAKKKGSSRRARVAAVVLGAGAVSAAPAAFAGAIVNCAGDGTNAASSQWMNAADGSAWNGEAWGGAIGLKGEGECDGGSGVVVGEYNSGNGGVNGSTAYITVGQTAYNGAGAITLYGPGGITLRGDTTTTGSATFQGGADMSGTKIVDVADGTDTKDAVNYGQLNEHTRYFKANSISDAPESDASATGNDSVAAGPWALASGATSTAVGRGAGAMGAGSVALGANSNAVLDQSVALGSGANAVGAGSVALGAGSVASRGNAVSVGSSTVQRQIINLAKGTAGTDAVNLDQMNAAIAGSSGGGSPDAVTYDSTTHDHVTLGGAGSGAPVMMTNLAAGQVATGSKDAVNGAQLYGTASSVASALGGNSTVGTDGKVSKPSYMVSGSTYNDVGSAITAVDAKAAAGPVDGVRYDTSAHDKVTFGGVGSTTPVMLTNLAAGQVTAGSKDAVNGAQLYGTANSVASALGGATTVGADGKLSKPAYTLDGNTYNDVGAALSAVDAKASTGSADGVKYDTSAHDKVTFGGVSAATPVMLTNVAAGQVTASSKDAINGAQLYGTANSVASALGGNSTVGSDGKISKPSYTVDGSTYNDVGAAITAVDARAAAGPVDGVKYDTSAHDKVTFGGVGSTAPVMLTNVAAGQVAASSKDAINGAQLYGTASSVASALGGTTTVGADGKLSKPAYTLDGNTYNDVGAALSAVDAKASTGSADGVKYDTSAHDKVTFGGVGSTTPVMLTNLAAGQVTASSKDAINGAQLYGAANSVADALGGSITVGADGKLSKPAYTLDGNTYNDVGTALSAVDAKASTGSADGVKYDTSAHDKVTFGGVGATTPVMLANLAAGAVNASSRDAINGAQLYGTANSVADALGGSTTVGTDGKLSKPAYTVDGSTYNDVGAAISAVDAKASTGSADGVKYDTSAHDKVTFGGVGATTPVMLANLAAGAVNASSRDAINGAQLYGTANSVADALGGLTTVGTDGKLSKPAYTVDGSTYNDVGAAISAVDAKASTGSADGVKYDTSAHDKVTFGGVGATTPVMLTNLAAGQVTASSKDAINGAQLYGTANSVADALGGSTTVGADGKLSKPAYTVDGSTYNDVGAAISAVDAKASTGSADGVKYDTSAHDKVTFGGVGAATPVMLTNVAAGQVTASSKDAINGAQLYGTANSVADALGGSTTVGADGKLSKPAYTVDGSTYNDVGAAISAVDAKASTGSADGVKYDTSAHDKVTFGGTGATTPVTLTNLASGQVTATSKDAINGAQLYGTASSVADALGGTTAVGADGKLSAPAYTIGTTTYHDVGSALDAMSATVDTINDDITNTTKYIKVTATASQAQASGANTIAIGGGTFAGTSGAVAIGGGATAMAANSVALGANSMANQANTLSVGSAGAERRITNVAAGTSSSDAATYGQLSALQQQLTKQSTLLRSSTLLGATSTPVTDYIAVSPIVTTGGDGTHVDTTKQDAMAIGPVSSAIGNESLAVGAGSFAAQDGATAVGYIAAAGAVNATVIGAQASTTNDANNGVAIGVLARAAAANAVSIGSNANTLGDSSVSIGSNAFTSSSAAQSMALGAGSSVSVANAVAIGANSVADRANTISVGSSTAQRQVVNMAAGTKDTDAVNISQLKGVTSAMGGGAGVNTDGSILKPSYTIGGKTYNDVGSALVAAAGAGSPDAVSYDTTSHTSVTLGGKGSATPVTLTNVATGAADSDAVNVKQLKDMGASIDGGGNVTNAFVAYDTSAKDRITLGGASGTKITNLAAGTLAANSTDAVNGSQLFATNQNVANVAGNVTNLTNVVNNITNGTTGVKYFHVNSTLADSSATGTNAVAIGGNAKATANNSIALGANATTTANLSAAAYNPGTGTLAGTTATGEVSLGSSGAERRITNLAAGSAATDAVNVSQLQAAVTAGSGAAAADAVKYDTSAHTQVTLGGSSAPAVTLTNLAAGVNNTDAVNVAQLKDMGAIIDGNGKVKGSFVSYDDSTLGTITLKGATGTKITGLSAGSLSATSSDAVNGSQLFATNQNVANVAGNVTNISNTVNNITDGGGVKYFHVNSTLADSSATGTNAVAIGGNAKATANNSIALGANATTTANLSAAAYNPGTGTIAGATPVGEVSVGSAGAERRVTNVAAGSALTDAVNVSQLQTAVQAGSAAATADAVKYDSTTHDLVTLGGAGTGAPAVTLTNLAAGAVNASSRDAINGTQLFNTANSVARALGGEASVGADGTVTAPTYTVDGKTYSDVGSAISAVSGSVDSINTDISMATKYIKVTSTASEAQASLPDTIAIGGGAFAGSNKAVAIGAGAMAMGMNSLALGANSRATQANTVSVGDIGAERRITNVASGTSASDAATYGQLSALQQQLTNQVSNVKSTMLLGATTTPVTDYIAVSPIVTQGGQGTHVDATKIDAMAVGPMSSAIGAESLAVGAGSFAARDNATAVGASAAAIAENSTVVGNTASTGSDAVDGVAIGHLAAVYGAEALALGTNVSARGNSSVAMGDNAFTSDDATQALALGAYSSATQAGSVALGANSVADRANVVSIGSSTAQRQLVNMAAGTSDTDAVNVAQLKGVTAAMGGGATVNPDGTIKNPTYTIDGTNYTDIGKAIEAAAATGGSGSPDAVVYDTSAHDRLTLGGSSAAPVALTNLAAGKVASSSTDAINGAQLYGTASSVAAALGGSATVGADGKVSKPGYTLDGTTYNDVGQAIEAVNAKVATGSTDGVKYDTSAHDKVTLGMGGNSEVVLTNVANATADTDAVNLRQLKEAGIVVDPSTGGVTNAFVAYDDQSKQVVTFNSGGKATLLKNIAAGVDQTDAVNLGQMQTYVANYSGGGGGTANAVAYDDSSRNVVTLGGVGHDPVKLTNIAAGTDATDAVNYSQFSSLENKVANMSGGDGGNTYINIDGGGDASGGTPASATGTDSIAIGNGASASGASAIAIGAHTSTTGDSSVALGVGSTASASNAVALGANSVADRANSVSVGSAGAERQITNVAAGTAPTDAVNVDQMNSAVNGVYKSMQDMDRDNRRGIASASALNIVTPYLPGRTTLNAGVAGYRGQAALGLGVSRWNEKGTVNYNLGVSTAGGNSTIVRAGVGIVLGN
ncbi:YadA-like family protein [Paraburkholderia sartisoli]|uniref:Head domain of trimeric autotransporter adhesin n=1 Tax=Paraburkholderia sartisoli TaxID=83784 RepID=A0A1H4GHV5_9BURK|nr:YadA-like family protein [Paraburkholderia sartisoli]SEB08600.1 Head domain of trimeric autotransporter adhesin [Paraburkholderia sartisoli]